jgi:serine/threonine protein kinase/Tol biopolymer transport system component
MPLAAGTKLGPYEVIAPLGAGGMGEVYRARDTRLSRDVAIKVLAEHLSAQAEVRARFEREAKTVSSLNHPNICTLFDIGREGETDFLVMELIEGETLAARLQRGPLPFPEVIRIGTQVADALDRAHRAGVVHRDLKPGNIMLTKSGAKLMDFGLARATGLAGNGSSSSVAMTHSPTVAGALTAEGTLVGTFQYMSPEQLEGREADTRSDLWALGCVLYEMATGRRAFAGATQASLISAIMRDTPRSIAELAPMSPPALERLVQQCLAKDPDDRWQSAGDVRRALEALVGTASVAGATSAVATAAPRGSRIRPATIAWALVALAAIAWGAFANRGHRPQPALLSVPLPVSISLSPEPSGVAISPDGRRVAFVSVDSNQVDHLEVRELDQVEPRLIAETESASHPFWSPDGRWIGFFTHGDRSQLKKVALAGGAPIALTDVDWSRGGTWNQKGQILYAPMPQGPLYVIGENGGTPVAATRLDSTRGETSHRCPCFLPDGEHFVYSAMPNADGGYAICVGALHSKEVRRIGAAASGVTYAAPGYLLYQLENRVIARRFDTRTLALSGDPVPLELGGPAVTAEDAPRVATASGQGEVAALSSAAPMRRIDVLDRSGMRVRTVPAPPGDYALPIESPDGTALVVIDSHGRNQVGVLRVDLARGTLERLVDPRQFAFVGGWSPDGKRLVINTASTGREEISIVPGHAGAGASQKLKTIEGQFKTPTDWSPDGRTILLQTVRPGTGFDLYAYDVASGVTTPVSTSPGSEVGAQMSPDGRWVCYVSDETGRNEVFVRAFPSGEQKTQVTTHGASFVVWGAGGRELVYLAPDLRSVVSVPMTNGVAGAERSLFRLEAGIDEFHLGLSHDGQRFYVLAPLEGSEGRSMALVQDWPALVKGH